MPLILGLFSLLLVSPPVWAQVPAGDPDAGAPWERFELTGPLRVFPRVQSEEGPRRPIGELRAGQRGHQRPFSSRSLEVRIATPQGPGFFLALTEDFERATEVIEEEEVPDVTAEPGPQRGLFVSTGIASLARGPQKLELSDGSEVSVGALSGELGQIEVGYEWSRGGWKFPLSLGFRQSRLGGEAELTGGASPERLYLGQASWFVGLGLQQQWRGIGFGGGLEWGQPTQAEIQLGGTSEAVTELDEELWVYLESSYGFELGSWHLRPWIRLGQAVSQDPAPTGVFLGVRLYF